MELAESASEFDEPPFELGDGVEDGEAKAGEAEPELPGDATEES